MKLFHETENKYYEILSYILNTHDVFSMNEISKILCERLVGEIDYEVIDSLFSKETGEESIFEYGDGKFYPLCNQSMPIRTTKIEKEAFNLLFKNEFARHFLRQETIEKGKRITSDTILEWDLQNVLKRNQYKKGAVTSEKNYENDIRLISKAILDKTGIKYDNIKKGQYEFRNEIVFPVKIEYSLLNDKFWVIAYEKRRKTFIKMQLESMMNIKNLDIVMNEVCDEYACFCNANINRIVLDVDPVDHVIERCFRIFSYYNRKAIYDERANQYILEISYLSYDENEIIRDVLSLGSSVIVVEPRRLQRELLRRIKLAYSRYE